MDPLYLLQSLVPQILSLAQKAGKEVMKIYFQENFATTYKGYDSPLTRADMASHDLILAHLRTLTPSLPVLSEESKSVPYDARQSWRTFWLVDPLDGTKEFIKRNGEFTINIALIEDCRPVLGVVHAPTLGLTYFAAHGVGAFKQTDNQVRAIGVRDHLCAPLKVVVSRSHADEGVEKLLKRIGPAECVYMGSSLKMCLVAEGAAHLYPRLGPTMEWDTAAAQCVVEMAGGTVSDLQGDILRYNKPDLMNPYFMASCDPETHSVLLAKIA